MIPFGFENQVCFLRKESSKPNRSDVPLGTLKEVNFLKEDNSTHLN